MPLEPSRQSVRGLMQPIIETGKPCHATAGPSRHFGERRQVNAVEASQPVSFGQFPRRSAQGVGRVKCQEARRHLSFFARHSEIAGRVRSPAKKDASATGG